MLVREFIELLPPDQQKVIGKKANSIAGEKVMDGGNDIWLSEELGMSRDAVEQIATGKRKVI